MYCIQHACVCLSVHSYVSKTTRQSFTKFFCTCYLWALVLIWWQHSMLCTSSFVDDIMFSHNGASGPKSDNAYVLSSLPGGGSGGEVCYL